MIDSEYTDGTVCFIFGNTVALYTEATLTESGLHTESVQFIEGSCFIVCSKDNQTTRYDYVQLCMYKSRLSTSDFTKNLNTSKCFFPALTGADLPLPACTEPVKGLAPRLATVEEPRNLSTEDSKLHCSSVAMARNLRCCSIYSVHRRVSN